MGYTKIPSVRFFSSIFFYHLPELLVLVNEVSLVERGLICVCRRTCWVDVFIGIADNVILSHQMREKGRLEPLNSRRHDTVTINYEQ